MRVYRRRAASLVCMALSSLAFVAALYSKENALTLPPLLLLSCWRRHAVRAPIAPPILPWQHARVRARVRVVLAYAGAPACAGRVALPCGRRCAQASKPIRMAMSMILPAAVTVAYLLHRAVRRRPAPLGR
jgi:hypothetical protein